MKLEAFLLESGTEESAFYGNEYVMSTSEARAIAFIDGKPFALKADDVKAGMALSRLLRNEGFLFFPVESQDLEP